MNIFIYGKYILPSFPHVRLVHNPLSRLPALPLHKIVMSALSDGGIRHSPQSNRKVPDAWEESSLLDPVVGPFEHWAASFLNIETNVEIFWTKETNPAHLSTRYSRLSDPFDMPAIYVRRAISFFSLHMKLVTFPTRKGKYLYTAWLILNHIKMMF